MLLEEFGGNTCSCLQSENIEGHGTQVSVTSTVAGKSDIFRCPCTR